MKTYFAIILLFLSCISTNSLAHELRPGYLEIKQISETDYQIYWKVPAKLDRRLAIYPTFPSHCYKTSAEEDQFLNNAYRKQWILSCTQGLPGNKIAIKGLNTTMTDVLLNYTDSNQITETFRLTVAQPEIFLPKRASNSSVMGTYTLLGIEHILLGVDHLLFVLALFMLVSNCRQLVFCVTAFTIAHSLTLVSATLGWVHVAIVPIETIIALSIVFLAMEITHRQRGQKSLAIQSPWIIAFVFGLLHGFGFASALTEIGLPQHALVIALLFFNLGVELGQLLFVATILMIGYVINRVYTTKPDVITTFIAYCVGSVAAFWTLERSIAIFT